MVSNDKTGQVLTADVSGKIVMKSFLTGMPDCRLTLNDRLVSADPTQTQRRGPSTSGIGAPNEYVICIYICVCASPLSVFLCFFPPVSSFFLLWLSLTLCPEFVGVLTGCARVSACALTLSVDTLCSKRAITLDDISFDRCVKLGSFDRDRSISFVPPDGEFELMGCVPGFNICWAFSPLVGCAALCG